jgi:DNA helicase-2/ATP-dependent DNA helicase PcrA
VLIQATQQELNPQQRAAACYGRDQAGKPFRSGPLLIIAGAGTGKTNTLAHRAAHLIGKGVAPKRVLLMTFSRRAAQELADRTRWIVTAKLKEEGQAENATISPVMPDTVTDLRWIGTFHSVVNRLLRLYAKKIGIDPGFTIIDRGDAGDLMDQLRHKLRFSSAEKRFPNKNTCIDIYSRCVNAQKDIVAVLEQSFPWCVEWADQLKSLFRAYTVKKQQQVTLDYDDLLLYWYHLAGEISVAKRIREQFDHILVDEYQDTNLLQAGILSRLFPDGEGVTVVGDDAQSIYSFRSAEVDNILNFPQLFSPPAKVIALNQNYRSVQPILDLSNALLKEASIGYKNQLFSGKPSPQKPRLISVEDQETQSQYVIENILLAREAGMALKQQAVLFRSSHHSSHLEVALRRQDIPYVKYGGLKFLDAAHVKDVLAILRWADNPKHQLSGFRVLKLLPGIGPALAEKILAYLALNQFDPKSLRHFQSRVAKNTLWQQFITLMNHLHYDELPWAEQMTQVSLWYKNILEQEYDNAFARAGDIEQLTLITQQYSSRERFLSDLTLDPPNATSDLSQNAHKDDDYLILSTVHSAKGQEWRRVFILNTVDGNFPNEYSVNREADMEEERRLFNVAITRAKQELDLIQPLRFWMPEQQRFGGKHVYGAKSRFLSESVCRTLEVMSYPEARLTEQDIAVGEEMLTKLKTTVLNMWD